jgi:hypothetical protein
MRASEVRDTGATIESIIGDPKQLDAELQSFRKDTGMLSSRRAMLLQKYPKRWVVIYNGKVHADARSFNEAIASADRLGLPRERVIIQFVDKNVRRMIL